MSLSEKSSEISRSYSHEEVRDELDRLNRQLEEMKETILNTSVRAHLLDADLATLFDPRIAEELQTAEKNCDKCMKLFYGEKATV